MTQAVLYGQVLTAVIQGGLGGLGLLVFGVPNALFWGAIMMITAFIPLLGTPLIWVPAGVGLILDGAPLAASCFLIYGATIVMNIDNFLRPRLVSGRVKRSSGVDPDRRAGRPEGFRLYRNAGGAADPGDPGGADQVLRAELHAQRTDAERPPESSGPPGGR